MQRPGIVLFGDSLTQRSFGPGGWGAGVADAYCRKVGLVLYSGNTRPYHAQQPAYLVLSHSRSL